VEIFKRKRLTMTLKQQNKLKSENAKLKQTIKEYEDKFKNAKAYLDERLAEIGSKDAI